MVPLVPDELDLADVVRLLAPGRTLLVERDVEGPTTDTATSAAAARIVAASGAIAVPFDRSGARELATAVELTRAALVLAQPDRTSAGLRVVRRTLAYYASRIEVPLATVDAGGRIRLVRPLGRTTDRPRAGSTAAGDALGEPAWP